MSDTIILLRHAENDDDDDDDDDDDGCVYNVSSEPIQRLYLQYIVCIYCKY